MTHLSSMPPHPVTYDQCRVEHLTNNNCVTLVYDKHQDHRSTTLALVDGEAFGIEKKTEAAHVEDVVAPFFKLVLAAHNQALSAGRKIGQHETRLAMRRAIGLD